MKVELLYKNQLETIFEITDFNGSDIIVGDNIVWPGNHMTVIEINGKDMISKMWSTYQDEYGGDEYLGEITARINQKWDDAKIIRVVRHDI